MREVRQLRYSLIHATPRPLIPDQVRNDEGVGLTTRASGGALASDAGDFSLCSRMTMTRGEGVLALLNARQSAGFDS